MILGDSVYKLYKLGKIPNRVLAMDHLQAVLDIIGQNLPLSQKTAIFF